MSALQFWATLSKPIMSLLAVVPIVAQITAIFGLFFGWKPLILHHLRFILGAMLWVWSLICGFKLNRRMFLCLGRTILWCHLQPFITFSVTFLVFPISHFDWFFHLISMDQNETLIIWSLTCKTKSIVCNYLYVLKFSVYVSSYCKNLEMGY